MKKLVILIAVAMAAPTAIAGAKGQIYFGQNYTDTIEAGVDIQVDNNVRFGIEKDDNDSRFRVEGYVGYKFNDHLTMDLNYRESDEMDTSLDDRRVRLESTVSKLGTPEWLLRDIRIRADYYADADERDNDFRGELRFRNRVRFGDLQWNLVSEITDINHDAREGSNSWDDGKSRTQFLVANELHYKVGEATVSYIYQPRYTLRGEGGFNRIRHTFEVQQRFDNEWRLRAGIRKVSTRDIHRGDAQGKDWNDDFVWRLGADYRF
ncbi:hypothetical protein [Photobacterium minamisatsumaniensis]|uniref:hypothetical protein n=1 Tax=Photobacterium minamisatsumaniensis TaxID=2910233 RepID=UPI003D0F5E83